MKPSGQPEQADCGAWPKSRVLRMLVRKFICNINDTRALVSLCFLVIFHLGQIRDPWQSQTFTKTNIVIDLSLQIHSFINLR